MRSAFALRIFSGRTILNFGVQKRLRAFLNPIFTDGVVTENGICSAAFCESAALRAGACSPERADFPRPGEDVTAGDKKGNLASRGDAWGSLLYRYEHLLIHKNVASETLSSFFATLSPEPFVK